MPVLFSSNVGRVKSVPDGAAAGSLSMANVYGSGNRTGLSFFTHNTIITGITKSAASNFQFLHTIGNEVYIYVFGDRVGEIVISGLSFMSNCDTPSQEHGYEALERWYQANRLAVNSTPVTVTIGLNTTFEGFITSMTNESRDTASRTMSFSLTLAVLPDPVIPQPNLVTVNAQPGTIPNNVA